MRPFALLPSRSLVTVGCVALLVACGRSETQGIGIPSSPDARPAMTDAEQGDVASTPDTGVLPDDGAVPDVGGAQDANAVDSSVVDAGFVDASTPDAGADRCTVQGSLPLPTGTVRGRVTGPSQNEILSCSRANTPQPEHIWVVEVMAPTAVTLTARAPGGEVALAVRTACESVRNEIACAPPRAGMNALQVELQRGRNFVIVELEFANEYELSITTEVPPAPNATCGGALPIRAGTPVPGQQLERGLVAPNTIPTCTDTRPTGNSLFYRVIVPDQTRLTAFADIGPFPGFSPVSVSIIDSCGGGQCLSRGTGLGPAEFSNTSGRDVEAFIVVSAVDATVQPEFTLETQLAPIGVGNNMCGGAQVIQPGQFVRGDTSTGSTQPVPCLSPGFPPLTEGSLFYRITVPAGQRLTAEAIPQSRFSPELVLMDGCVNSACLSPGGVRATFDNTNRTPRDIWIAVGHRAMTTPGIFTLETSITPATVAPMCSMPITVMPPNRFLVDTTMGGTPAAACQGFAGSNMASSHFYEVEVPPAGTLEINAFPLTTAVQPIVEISQNCGANSCLARSMPSPAGATATWRNTGAMPERVIVAAGHQNGTMGGRLNLTFELQTVAPHADCMNATMVRNGTTLRNESTSRGGQMTTPCHPPGRDITGVLYYTIGVPAGETLSVFVSPNGAPTGRRWRPQVGVFDSCTNGVCLQSGGGVFGQNGESRVLWPNNSRTDRTVLVAVGHLSTEQGGNFDVLFSTSPPPRNVTCNQAVRVMGGTRLSNEDAAFGQDDLSSACLPGVTGGVLYYSVEVQPNDELTVTATPRSPFSPAIRLLDTCGAASCVANAPRIPGRPVTLRHTHSGTVSADLIIAVGAGDTTFPGGQFDLAVDVARQLYTESTIGADCANMTGAPMLPGVDRDDSSSNITALPFTIPFFQNPVTHFSVSSNGFMQLYPSPMGQTNTSFSNQPIPSPGLPNNLVAPLWDDLVPGVVRTRTSTSGGRHFIVEWSEFGFFSDRNARLTYQAKLFEAGTIELHYCTLMAGNTAGRETGSQATIGIENDTGIIGNQRGHNQPNAIDTMNAILYTPIP